MAVSNINSSAISIAETPERLVAPTVKTLGQDEFLKLLVTRMTTQDPLNPQQDTEFISQMAQFSALEQSKAMQKEMTQMRSEQELLSANGLIGRTVSLRDGKHDLGEGVVTSVDIQNGTPKIVVNAGSYGLEMIDTISPFQVSA